MVCKTTLTQVNLAKLIFHLFLWENFQEGELFDFGFSLLEATQKLWLACPRWGSSNFMQFVTWLAVTGEASKGSAVATSNSQNAS